MITKSNRDKLENSDIRIFERTNMLILVKINDSKGNFIPNHKCGPVLVMDKDLNVLEEVFSNCPFVSLGFENEVYSVSVWDWSPGPGPGDFEVYFDTEQKAFDRIWNYFFENNTEFNLRRDYHKKEND